MQFFTQGVNGIRKDARLIDGFSIFSIEDTLGKGNDEFGNDVFKRHRSGAYTVMYVDKGAGSHHIDFQKSQCIQIKNNKAVLQLYFPHYGIMEFSTRFPTETMETLQASV